MIGKVTIWYMTEEERLAYIDKHPIVPYEVSSGQTFAEKHKEKLRAAAENGGRSTKDKWQEKRLARQRESENKCKL